MKQLITPLLSIVLGLLLFVIPVTEAKESIPPSLSYGGKTLMHNGSGLRKKLFITLYAGSLYLTEKSKDAEKIIADDSPMAIRLAIRSSLISPEKMKEATLEGFKKSTGGNLAPIQAQIDELLKTFDKGVGPGDVYELINMPGSGVHVIRNGVKMATIRSPAFKKALFGIWLSKTPVQVSLKRQMLGM